MRGTTRCGFVGWLIVSGTIIALGLVAYGAFLAPATSRLSIVGAALVLIAYGALGWAVVPRFQARCPAAVEIAQWAGLAGRRGGVSRVRTACRATTPVGG